MNAHECHESSNATTRVTDAYSFVHTWHSCTLVAFMRI